MLGRLNQNSLKIQLVVVIGIAALVGSLLFGALASRLSRGQIEHDQGRLLQQVAQRMVTQLAQDMNSRAQELLFVSQLDQLRQDSTDTAIEQAIIDRMKSAYPVYTWIGLLDTRGTIIASTEPTLLGLNAAPREWFIQGSQGLYFGDAHQALLLAKLMPKPRLDDLPARLVDISVPVHDRQGTLKGVLAAHVNIEWAFDARERVLDALMVDGLDMVVLNREGRVLLGTPDMPSLQVDLSKLQALRRANDSHIAATMETWPDGLRYMTMAVAEQGLNHYPGFGWTVVVRFPQARAMATANRVQDMMIWGGVFSALLFAALLWWLLGRQLRPLERLSRAARQLHPGGADSTRAILALPEPEGNNEVAHFTRSLVRLVKALGESQERFRSLFTHAQVPLVHSASDGRLLDQNIQFKEALGYSQQEVSTLEGWWACAFPDPLQRRQAHARWSTSVQQAPHRGGSIERGEFTVTCKNGLLRTVEMSGFVMPDASVLIAFHDITDVRQAESHARMWAESFEQAQLSLMISDVRTHTVASVNPAFARERGYEPDDMVGMTAEQMIPRDRHGDLARIYRALKGRTHGRFETEHLTRDGQRFPVLLDVTVLRDGQGKADSCVIYALNLTERKRAEQALAQAQAAALVQQQQAQRATLQQMEAILHARHAAEAAELEVRRLNTELEQRVAQRTAALSAANRELDSFAFTVSHDLRAPLRTITGFADILLHEHQARLDADMHACVECIAQVGKRMSELIEGLLTLSGIARSSLRCDTVDLSSLATRRLAELAQAEPDRQVQVDVEPGLRTFGDTRMVDALLSNLVDNAWKYTRKTPDAHIRVCAGSVNGVPGFCVKDNGAGFDMAQASRLFVPFQRLHRQDDFPGTGVGLATVQRIVQRHGGELCVDATAGQGACFCFTLPHAPLAGASAAQTEAAPASPRQ